jgi:folate-dependent phosphoribosylglycinamide formyltransferase PurN
VPIEAKDTPEQVDKKVQALEHQYFPMEIEKLLHDAD